MEDSEVQLKDIDLNDSQGKQQFSFSNSENPLGPHPDNSLVDFIPDGFSKHDIMKRFYEEHDPLHRSQLRKSIGCISLVLAVYVFICIPLTATVGLSRWREGGLHFVYFVYAFFSMVQELMLAFSYRSFYDQYDRDFLVARNQVASEQRGDGLLPVEAFGLEASTCVLLNRVVWGQLERLTVYLDFVLVFSSFGWTEDVGLQAAAVVFFINALILLSCVFPIYGATLKPASYPDKLRVFCSCSMHHGLAYISELVAIKSRRMYAEAEVTEVRLKHERRPVFAGLYWAFLFGGFFCLQIYYLAAHRVRLSCIASLLSAVAVLVQRLQVSC